MPDAPEPLIYDADRSLNTRMMKLQDEDFDTALKLIDSLRAAGITAAKDMVPRLAILAVVLYREAVTSQTQLIAKRWQEEEASGRASFAKN